MKLDRIAFLDRDGVINHDRGYIGCPNDFELIDNVPEALRLLHDMGYALAVVTNQSGIGRGYYTEDDYQRVTDWMCKLLTSYGIKLATILHCPHTQNDRCECRKPKPGMLIDGAERIGASLNTSILFGDKGSDIAAGRAAGVARCFFVGSEVDINLSDVDGCGMNLFACVQLLLGI